MSNTPFEIDPRLVGHHECYSDALFAFDILNENRERDTASPFIIRGGRYSAFVQKMNRSRVPATGAVFIFKDKKIPAQMKPHRTKYVSPIYLVQLGFGPKVRSLLLIDELRQAGIGVRQNITSDSLSEQLRQAETTNTRYAIILGHKEFMDGTVILRDLEQQHQENVPAAAITAHLKRLIAVA
jgi:histidyl-tRNA synthetase